MALERKDLVQDTASSTGTGAFVMAGTPPAGFQAFSVHTNGATFDYKASAGAQWEVGVGTWNGTNIARSPTASSNANGLVNFTTAPTVMEVVSAASVATFLRAADGVDVSTLTPVGSLIAGDTVLLMRSGVLYTAAYTLFGSGAATATGVTFTGPTTGAVSVASSNFTVGVTPVGGAITGTVTVTPSDNGGGGAFNPVSVPLTSAAPSATFTYTPSSVAGARSISVANNGSLSNPANITYTSTATAQAATAIQASGPTSGTVSAASSNFTVSANGTITGTVVVTPSDSAAGGTFTPNTVSISSATPTATFTYTPNATAGAKTISFTNNGSLSNPANITYTANAAGATQYPRIVDLAGSHATETGPAPYSYSTPSNLSGLFDIGLLAGQNGTFVFEPGSASSAWTIGLVSAGKVATAAAMDYDIEMQFTSTYVYSVRQLGSGGASTSAVATTDKVRISRINGTLSFDLSKDGGATYPTNLKSYTGVTGAFKFQLLSPFSGVNHVIGSELG